MCFFPYLRLTKQYITNVEYTLTVTIIPKTTFYLNLGHLLGYSLQQMLQATEMTLDKN